MNTLLDNLRSWWQNASAVTRAAATGLAVLVVIGIIAAGVLSTAPNNKVIFRSVSPADASSVSTVLREHNIAMKYSAEEGTISVPSKDSNDAIMYVEGAGVLGKDAALSKDDPMDKIGMATSTEVEQSRLLQSQQLQAERILNGVSHVQAAHVILTPGSNSSLFGDQAPPQASVMLTLQPGEQLDPLQVRGIVNFMTSAVSGLTAKNIKLVDNSGTPLWIDDGHGNNQAGGGQPTDENGKFAQAETARLQQMLDMALGPHKSIVTVNAELDFDQTQTDSVQNTPMEGSKTAVPLSVHRKTENYTGSGPAPVGGAAGSGSNLTSPSYPSTNGGSGGNYKGDDTTTNYAVNRTETHVQKTPGQIRKETVAAMVDASIPAATIQSLNAILGTAIGAAPGDPTRLVTVQQIPFDTSAQKAAQDALKMAASQALWANISKALAVSAAAGILLYLLMRAGRQPAKPRLALEGGGEHIGLLDRIEATPAERLETMLEERPLSIEDVLAEMPEAIAPIRPVHRRSHAPAIEEHQDLKLESIQDMISTSPESVALLLKGWMSEETKVG